MLRQIETIQVPGISLFVAKENFREGEVVDGMMISRLGENFKRVFLPQVDKDIPPAVLRVHALNEGSLSVSIVERLNGTSSVHLSQVWKSLMQRQGFGEKGIFHVDENAGIAHVLDRREMLWTIHFKWYDTRYGGPYHGWYFGALPHRDNVRWEKDSRVLSQ